MDIKCVRCKKKIEQRHYMIQIIEYLGGWNPREDICDDCYRSFINFMNAGVVLSNATYLTEGHIHLG